MGVEAAAMTCESCEERRRKIREALERMADALMGTKPPEQPKEPDGTDSPRRGGQ